MDAAGYLTDLSDCEWELIKDLFESEGTVGRPPTYSRRTMVNACCYVIRNGCAWRSLPKTFPHWGLVYKTYRRWFEQGRFQRMHDRMRQHCNERDRSPAAVVLDWKSERSSL